ncbi:MAG: 4Fe-4S dicluster domain-containing protein [Deltaproteobacteria bacterium]|nr:4Fe-4S dicluster domain-containing protein [Deltaproteobacteria bacterium]
MGHLTSKSGYQRLRQRLDQMPVGAPGRTTIYEILSTLYTPEEAELTSKMPMRPRSVESIAKNLGMAPDELRPRLEALAEKGLILDLWLAGKMRYALAPTIVGIFEFSMMRVRTDLDQKKLAGLMRHYLLEEEDFTGSFEPGAETSPFRTLVHEESLPENYAEILDWERATHIVKQAGKWSLSLCHCRHVEHHLGNDCRVFRMESCMSLGMGADYVARNALGRPIELNEALDLLAETREAGLVHIADNVKNRPTFICNCCSCCCEILQGFKRFKWLGTTFTSNYLACCEQEICTGCRKCEKACPVDAITIVKAPHEKDGKRYRFAALVNRELCLGCGVCALKCEDGAMHMESRSKRRIPPVNTFARVMTMAIEQGKLHYLLADALDGWSGKVAGALIGAVLKLTPARQLLARQELKSRFVDMAIQAARKRNIKGVDL